MQSNSSVVRPMLAVVAVLIVGGGTAFGANGDPIKAGRVTRATATTDLRVNLPNDATVAGFRVLMEDTNEPSILGAHLGKGVGVFGKSDSNYAGAFISDNNGALYARGDPSFYTAYIDGRTYLNGNLDVTANASITGDLTVGGTCSGCSSTQPSKNVGDSSIAAGDLVAAAGVTANPKLKQPVLLVRRASGPEDIVVGVADKTMRIVRTKEGQVHTASGKSSASKGELLLVTTQGLTKVRVSGPSTKLGTYVAPGPDAAAVSSVGPGIGQLVDTPNRRGLVWAMIDM